MKALVSGPSRSPRSRAELDRRLDAYAADGNRGRPAADAIADIRCSNSMT